MQAKKQTGARLGRPVSDLTRLAGVRVQSLRSDGVPWPEVCRVLTSERFATPNGGRWHETAARRTLVSLRLDDEAATAAAAAACPEPHTQVCRAGPGLGFWFAETLHITTSLSVAGSSRIHYKENP